MGVHGLWELLAPVGRRVSVETLAGKKLAIDASIWMVQFMKAMRDEKGEMIRNAHLLGFFRRICKLLYLKTKPIFVFDGGTPVLKRRTVIARRRQRENAQAKIRKTAEKLLLNHLKQMRLKELSKDLENQRKNQKKNVKGRKVSSDEPNQDNTVGSNACKESESYVHDKPDEELEDPLAAKEDGSLTKNASISAVPSEKEECEEDDEIILPAMDGVLDPDVLAALPLSMQHRLLSQNDPKGKRIFSDELDQSDMEGISEEHNPMATSSYNQEKLDEMLAASLMAEENGGLTNNASTSAAAIPSEEDVDEDEEMIFPTVHGNVDPAVLAALPPSMQLDLLVQMRERLMAENRQKYQKVKKAPEKFSELQIQSYLKTVAFRREIDEVQKAAAGRGVGGVQTSRIASESNREFIFSSSFNGDKQILASSRVERNGDKQPQILSNNPSDPLDTNVSISKSNDVVTNEPRSALGKDIETYLDESGRVRVSRVRAMGIRMTRDLQRNLDLMKEVEQEKTNSNNIMNVDSILDNNEISTSKSSPMKNQSVRTSHDSGGISANLEESDKQSMFQSGASLEITIEDDGNDNDDGIFACLVAGDHVALPSPESSPTKDQSLVSGSDCEWEEGIIEGRCNSSANDVNTEINPSLKEVNISDESEVEWDEGPSDAPKYSSRPAESGKALSRGYVEEEADLQEAIRRSLIDLSGRESNYSSSKLEKPKNLGENASGEVELLHEKCSTDEPTSVAKNITQQNESCEIVDQVQMPNSADGVSISETTKLSERQLKLPVAYGPDNNEILENKPCEKFSDCHSDQSKEGRTDNRDLYAEMPPVGSDGSLRAFHPTQNVNDCNEDNGSLTADNMRSKDVSYNFDAALGEVSDAILADDRKSKPEGEQSFLVRNIKTGHGIEPSIVVEDRNDDVCPNQRSPREGTHDNDVNERKQDPGKSATEGNYNVQVEFTEAALDEELLVLGQECMNLGDEQRKLERNAESVSSEMFAECQELLQMFGLPYIIAPMEAEAQCAYMELANIVDGVVTDDSDVFLFGSRSVYKNIFDDRKYVETYFMEDIEKELGLDREKLIRMALLLGSDYTEGVSGIGIVNAIEVVNAYPEEDGLNKFREWIESPDPSILGKFAVQVGSSKKKKGSNFTTHEMNCAKSSAGVSSMEEPSEENRQSADCLDGRKQIFMDKHRNVSKNWHIPVSFPSEAVILAYSSPQVDKSTEPFTWGKPDLFVLRKLCWEKFGWGSQKTDELLVPVLKEYEKRETQLRLEAFYSFNERFAKIRSKRIKKAVKGIIGKQCSELIDDSMEEVSKSRKKRRASRVQSENIKSKKPSAKSGGTVSGNQSNSKGESIAKRPRTRKDPGKFDLSDREHSEPPVAADGRQTNIKQSCGNIKVKDRGGGRGRGKATVGSVPSENTSSEGSSSDDEQDVQTEKLQQPQEVRRSARSRNSVNYAEDELDTDEFGISLRNKEFCSKTAAEQDLFKAQSTGRDVVDYHLNENSQHEVSDPITEKGFCRDYLETGGAFGTDEAEIGHPGASQEDPSFEAELSKSYLKTGGGFCEDEDDTNNEQDASYLQAMGKTDSSSCPAFMDKADDYDLHPSIPVSKPERASDGLQQEGKSETSNTELNLENRNAADEGKTGQENTKTDPGRAYAGALRAMPYLKRKRRKN